MGAEAGAAAATDSSRAEAEPHASLSRGDVWGGIAGGLVALPSAIAYGVVVFSAVSPALASNGALAGLIGAAILGVLAPLVSRNGGFVTAPCAPAAAVLSGVAIDLISNRNLEPTHAVAVLGLIGLFAGVLQAVYGFAGFGTVIKYLPYQVVTGYTSGVAIIIAVAQLPKLLGVRSPGFFQALVSTAAWQWPAIAVGLVTIVAMVVAPRLTKSVPSPIVALACGIATYFAIAIARPTLLDLEGNTLIVGTLRSQTSLVGAVVQRLGSIHAFSVADASLVIAPALTLSLLLSIDTLKTGVVLDALLRHRHDSNRELIGQGVANALSFVGGGMPGAAASGPSLVNVSSGARSYWSGVIAGVLALAAYTASGSVLAWLPISALAGILLVIAWRMFDFKIFRLALLPGTRLDFVIIATVIVVAEAVGLIQAALAGVALSIVVFIRNQMRGTVIARKADLTEVHSKRRRSHDESAILEQFGGEALLVQLKDDLFFGTTDRMFTELELDLATRRYILFDLRRVQSLDYTAVHLLRQMQQRLRESGGELLFSGLPSGVANRQDIGGYITQLGLLSETHAGFFEIRDNALEWLEEQILARHGWTGDETATALGLDELQMLRSLGRDALGELRREFEERSYAAGETIFRAGESSDAMYIVRRGRVHALLPLPGGKRHHVATFGRGEFFGEIAFLDRESRSADAVAATPTDLFLLSRSRFDQLAERNAALASNLFGALAAALAQRLRVTDAELQVLEER